MTIDLSTQPLLLPDIFQSPNQMVEAELQYIYSFPSGHLPCESETEDDPPRPISQNNDIIPIDELLGLYSYPEQRITIFNKGIREASEILSVNFDCLKFIVRIHEWSHAILHLGVSDQDRSYLLRDESLWATQLQKADNLFQGTEDTLQEYLAQMLTLYSIQSLKERASSEQSQAVADQIHDIFHVLAKRQPSQYQTKEFAAIPKRRILESIRLLKNGWLVGKTEPWKLIITW